MNEPEKVLGRPVDPKQPTIRITESQLSLLRTRAMNDGRDMNGDWLSEYVARAILFHYGVL